MLLLLQRRSARKLRALDLERSAEATGGIIRFGAVVIDENGVIAAVTKKGAAELSDRGRCLDPAGGLGVKVAEFLQLAILFFRKKLNPDGGRQVESAAFRLMFLAGVQGFTVIAKAAPSLR